MNFDRLAPHYDWLEALTSGQRLQRARTAWLDKLENHKQVLSVGEGHGRFAATFSARFPHTQLTCVEDSEKMLTRARKRTPKPLTPINWVRSDFFHWMPNEKYDAIVTCFFLDCFSPEMLPDIIAKLSTCASPAAVWIVVDFAVPPSGMARWRAKAVHTLMYAFFRLFASLPAKHQTEPDDILRAHGFQLEGRRHYEWGLVRADVWRRG